MADPQLTTLAKHCRRMAATDRANLAAARTGQRRVDPPDRIAKRLALWNQIADEIDAYLNGTLEQTEHPDQLTIG